MQANPKFIKIILSVFIIIFLFAGYLYLTGKIKFNNKPAKEITGTTQKTETETSGWKTYRNEKYGFEVKYPTFWGDVVISDNSVSFSSNDDFFGADIDYKKLLTEKHSLDFNKNNDFKADIIVFSKDKPLQLDCYEGICDAKNLFDDKSYVENHFNKDVNDGVRWLCEENYFAPAASLLKTCRTYIDTTLIKLEASHKLVNRLWLDNYAGDRGKISFQDAYGQIQGDEKKKFDLLVSNFNNLLDNIAPLRNRLISGWKTYLNEEYGFEFKYPAEWEKSKIGNFFTAYPSVNVLQLNFENKDSKTTLSDFVSNVMKENDCKSVDFPNEGDHVIEITATGIYYVLFCAVSSEVYHYATEINDNLILDFNYKDDFNSNSSEDEKIKVFKEIISTLKFME